MSTYDEAVHTFTVGELTVKIIQDTDAPNPRKEYDNVGTMVCWHRNYELGDEQRGRDTSQLDFFKELAFEIHPELEDYFENGLWNKHNDTLTDQKFDNDKYQAVKKAYNAEVQKIVGKILDKYYVMLPLGLYDHSGISMYVGSQSHWSDPGGWDSGQVGWIYCTVKKAKEEWAGADFHERAIEYLKGEVETYNQYLTGDVYGYVVEDADGEQLDACWGFFGRDCCEQEAKAAAESEWADILEARRKADEIERHAQEWEQRMMAL